VGNLFSCLRRCSVSANVRRFCGDGNGTDLQYYRFYKFRCCLGRIISSGYDVFQEQWDDWCTAAVAARAPLSLWLTPVPWPWFDSEKPSFRGAFVTSRDVELIPLNNLYHKAKLNTLAITLFTSP